MSYYVKTGFRCLDDEQVGEMQRRMIDDGESAERVARTFKVCVSTAYKVRAAVPAHLVHFHAASWTLHRRRLGKKRTA